MGTIRLYFTVDDIEQMRDYLLSNGVECGPLRRTSELALVDFADHDGNPLGLFQATEAYAQEIQQMLGDQ